jgi:hypothetical protein
MRYPYSASLVLPSLAFVALALPACVDSAATQPVLAQQREAILDLERSSAEDLVALRSLASTLLRAREERLLSTIEQRLITESLDASAEARADAPMWLVEYAALLRAGSPADARRAPLANLPEVIAMRDAGASLLAALDARALDTAALFASALADNAALSGAAGASVDLSSASREAAIELWRAALLDRIDDPAQRAAAERLLADLLRTTN